MYQLIGLTYICEGCSLMQWTWCRSLQSTILAKFYVKIWVRYVKCFMNYILKQYNHFSFNSSQFCFFEATHTKSSKNFFPVDKASIGQCLWTWNGRQACKDKTTHGGNRNIWVIISSYWNSQEMSGLLDGAPNVKEHFVKIWEPIYRTFIRNAPFANPIAPLITEHLGSLSTLNAKCVSIYLFTTVLNFNFSFQGTQTIPVDALSYCKI